MKSNTLSSKRIILYFTRTVVGFLAGAVTLIYIQGCASAPQNPWHKANLKQEFSARKTDEVQTLEDYRKLEERLFAELEEKVYAKTETGPDYALVRYSTGSAAEGSGW